MCSWAIFAMRGAAIYSLVLLLAVTSQQATGKRLLGPASRSTKARALVEQKDINHLDGDVPGAGEDADGAAGAESHDFTSNPVMKDPLRSKLQPSDLEGTRHVYDKLKKLEDDAGVLQGSDKLKHHLEMQLGESEFLIREHGANNILSMLQAHNPTCHNVAHQVGRAAVRVTNDITHLLKMCEAGCKVGCFHGVIMGLVIDSYKGDFSAISKEEKTTYVAGLLREMCDEETIGIARVGTCIHGVGHAAVVASDGHDLQMGMEICMAAFYDDRKKQHHCGTGASMNEKSKITQDAFNICSKVPMPASCFEYGFTGAPKKLNGGSSALIMWGKEESLQCTKLATMELQEACLYGLGTLVGRTISEEEKHDPEMVEMKARMSVAVQKVCLEGLEGEVIQKACMLGTMRYANRWFRQEATQVICSAVSDTTEIPDCMEDLRKSSGYGYMDHFAIPEPLDKARW